ncbi:VHS1036 protein [Vibrio phage 1]|nr:VHS1036 protein [Vibrio phage 1]
MNKINSARQIREVIKLNRDILKTADLPMSYRLTVAEIDNLARVFIQELEKQIEEPLCGNPKRFLEALIDKLLAFECLIKHRQITNEDAQLTNTQAIALMAGNLSFKYAYELILSYKANHQ